jgi:hypothetical protein
MQRILLVAAVVAAGLTGCANPGPNYKPPTNVPPAPLTPPRPDQMNFPTASGSQMPPPSFPNPRDSSGLNPPGASNPGMPMPAPSFPGAGGQQTNSSTFVPRSQNMASTQIATPPGGELPSSAMPGASSSDFARVGAPSYGSPPSNLPPPIPTSNQSLSVPLPPPQYGQMPTSVPQYGQMPTSPPMYQQPIGASTMPPAMPPPQYGQMPTSVPQMSPQNGGPTTVYPGGGSRLQGF